MLMLRAVSDESLASTTRVGYCPNYAVWSAPDPRHASYRLDYHQQREAALLADDLVAGQPLDGADEFRDIERFAKKIHLRVMRGPDHAGSIRRPGEQKDRGLVALGAKPF